MMKHTVVKFLSSGVNEKQPQTGSLLCDDDFMFLQCNTNLDMCNAFGVDKSEDTKIIIIIIIIIIIHFQELFLLDQLNKTDTLFLKFHLVLTSKFDR